MDTALKQVFPFLQPGNVEVTALNDSSPGYRKVAKAARTFRSHRLPTIKAVDETTAIVEALLHRFPRLREPAYSSNAVRLVELARRRETPAHLIDGAADIRAA